MQYPLTLPKQIIVMMINAIQETIIQTANLEIKKGVVILLRKLPGLTTCTELMNQQ